MNKNRNFLHTNKKSFGDGPVSAQKLWESSLKRRRDYASMNLQEDRGKWEKGMTISQKIELKHKEDLQRLRGFRLFDDDFLTKCFESKMCWQAG